MNPPSKKKKQPSVMDIVKTALFTDVVAGPYRTPGCQKAGGAPELPLGPHSLLLFSMTFSHITRVEEQTAPSFRPACYCESFRRSSIPSGGAGGETQPQEAPVGDPWLVSSFRYSFLLI